MIASQHMPKIVAVLVCACLLFCGAVVYAADAYDMRRIPEYQKRMFGDEIVTLDIQVDGEIWQNLLDNAQAKEWISVGLMINGERFGSVGVRAKGNSSLAMGGGMRGRGGGDGGPGGGGNNGPGGGGGGNNGGDGGNGGGGGGGMRGGNNGGNIRYSLQFKLNKYVKSQTYHGLDTFCVNNMMGDATYMKDYLSFAIMDFIGVATPLVNYAHVTVSGEDYGFGLVLERYDKAFLDRVYSTSGGQLYNVKIGMGMRGDFEAQWQDVTNHMPNRRQRGTGAPAEGPQGPGGSGSGGPGGGPGGGGSGSGDPGGGGSGGPGGGPGVGNPGGPGGGPAPGGGGSGPGGGGSGPGGLGVGGDEFPQGGALIYTDDEISSYNAIFDNSVFKSSDREKRNVITAIKHLNAGTDFEKSWDVDQIIRYFAAHTVLVNLDSYTSNMQQNYYLYERNGKVTVLPWDYGLAFGGFLQSGDASSVVNYPIDTPVSGVSMEERPLLNKLLEVDEYREAYHGYLRQIVEGYFESGQFESTIRGLDAKINEYVKNNVNVYYTYKQYEASLPVLTELGRLRAVSIKAQLDGTIPSTSHGQRAFSSSLIDASGISLSVLGAMSGGRGG